MGTLSNDSSFWALRRLVGGLGAHCSAQNLESALRAISDLDVMIAPGLATSENEPLRQFDLEVVGSDHPGIVREVFKSLAQVFINVEELSTRAYSAPDSWGILFEAKARLTCS